MSQSITTPLPDSSDPKLIYGENARHNQVRRALFLIAVKQAILLLFVLSLAPTAQAQSCENIPTSGTESISAQISINATGTAVTDGMVIAPYTQLRIDSIATAFGSCTGMAWSCSGGCSCQPTGYVYQRNINHTNVWVDVSTNQSLNGTYSIGKVWGVGSNQNVLDTQLASSTGPNYYTPPYAGTYEIHVQGIINGTPCNLTPYETEIVTITVHVGEGPTSLGATECNNEVGPSSVGEPINVTNGNMYIQQTDYRLPGFGDGLEIARTYNSKRQVDGLFGYGWTSILDESIHTYGTKLLRVTLADGATVYLARANTGAP